MFKSCHQSNWIWLSCLGVAEAGSKEGHKGSVQFLLFFFHRRASPFVYKYTFCSQLCYSGCSACVCDVTGWRGAVAMAMISCWSFCEVLDEVQRQYNVPYWLWICSRMKQFLGKGWKIDFKSIKIARSLLFDMTHF